MKVFVISNSHSYAGPFVASTVDNAWKQIALIKADDSIEYNTIDHKDFFKNKWEIYEVEVDFLESNS